MVSPWQEFQFIGVRRSTLFHEDVRRVRLSFTIWQLRFEKSQLVSGIARDVLLIANGELVSTRRFRPGPAGYQTESLSTSR